MAEHGEKGGDATAAPELESGRSGDGRWTVARPPRSTSGVTRRGSGRCRWAATRGREGLSWGWSVTKIEAIIRPFKLDAVKKALDHVWVAGITVTEVKGYGRQGGHSEFCCGNEYQPGLVPKLKVEVVVPDPLVPRVLDDLERSLKTGKIGDGKIFVTRLDEAVRIRTGERGEDAL